MSGFTVPDLSQQQQAFIQEAFATDLEYLKSIEKNNLPTYSFFIHACCSSSLSILTAEESQTLHQITDRSEQHAEILKMVKERGPKAILFYYIFLNMNKTELYDQLPSSKGNDKKIELVSKLRDEFLLSLKTNFSEFPQKLGFPGVSKPTASVATVRPLIHGKDETPDKSMEEKERNRGKDKLKKETELLNDDEEKPRPKYQRRSWGVKKDDEFFHFIVICFSIGAALIASYNYADWTMSAGIGLICFATIETIAIYFGLIQQIRKILDYLQNYRLPGLAGWTKQK